MSDSCDSDKSCSPGANRNNRYNISDAHRAYLAGKQIQASMFVTTQSSGADLMVPAGGTMAQQNLICAPATDQAHGQALGTCNGGRRWGLLKTIDVHNSSTSGANAHQSAHQHQAATDYFGNCNLSDRSTTDDSRAPLDRLSPQQRDIMPAPQPLSSGGPTRFHINRSISMSSKFPIVGRAAAAATTSFGHMISQRNNEQARGNNNNNNNHNYQQQQQQQYNQKHSLLTSSSNNNQRVYELNTGDLLPISAEEEWPEPYVEPVQTNTGKDVFANQSSCNDNNNNNHNSSQHIYGTNDEKFASSSTVIRHPHHHHHHDHQFNSVDNHHCQDRQLDVNYIQQAQVISNHLLTNRSYDEAYLANWRTIGRNPTKSTADPNHRATTVGGGGANWLRWTPANDGS